MHSGKRSSKAKAEGAKALERKAAEVEVEKRRARLGVEAVDEPHEVTALREIRKARGNVAAWQEAVDQLVASKDGDVVAATAVHTGNPKKPNEVEKHYALARLDEERDRLMEWIAVARRLGIEEARLEQQDRIAQADAERVIAVIRLSLESSKAALLAAGAAKALVEQWYRDEVPAIVAAAIDATSTEVTA